MFKPHQFDYLIPGIGIVIAVASAVYFYEPSAIYYLALLLTGVGLLLWFMGKLALGPNWSSAFKEPKAAKLVTHSIYAKMRHPIYYGVTLFFIGLALHAHSIYLWVFVALHTAYLAVKCLREERLMSDKFSSAYQDYKKETWL